MGEETHVRAPESTGPDTAPPSTKPPAALRPAAPVKTRPAAIGTRPSAAARVLAARRRRDRQRGGHCLAGRSLRPDSAAALHRNACCV